MTAPLQPAAIAPYVTSTTADVYCLRNLPEEVIAVLFAYYSRSEGSLRDNLAKLVQQDGVLPTEVAVVDRDDDELARARETAAKFHDKWVVGYGHASVAEHAVAHVAVENASILAIKAIEDCRLASYTEKSTRYVWFDVDGFITPTELDEHPPLKERYRTTCRSLMQTYLSLRDAVQTKVRELWPRESDVPQRLWEARTKAKACDLCRYLLPASTTTNVGITLNARVAEHMIRKLASHPLAEMRAIAAAMKEHVQQMLPTLVKYADRNAHLAGRADAVQSTMAELGFSLPPTPETANAVRATSTTDGDALIRDAATAIAYEAAAADFATVADRVASLTKDQQLALIDAYLSNRDRWDAAGRALERVQVAFEIAVDYGAFRDIQRHRMCTQLTQTLGCDVGHDLPAELLEWGFGETLEAAMAEAKATWQALAEVDRHVASYVVPMAFRNRTLFVWNLRELFHFIPLRSSKQGHASYRRVAQDAWRALQSISPELAARVPVDMNDYALGRSGKETVA